MKRLTFCMAIVLFILASGTAAVAADASVAIDLNSAYVWRGITFNDGLVIQPSIDVSRGGFGINVWGNFDIDDYDDTLDDKEFSEIDVTLYYGFTLDPVDISLGYVEYLFPAGGEGTREAYLNLGTPIVDGLSIGVTAYYDVDEVHGWYGNIALSYEKKITDTLGIDVSAGAGCADKSYAEAYGGEDSGLYDYTFSLGISYALSKGLGLRAGISYADTLDEDVLPDDLVDTNLYGGINVSYLF